MADTIKATYGLDTKPVKEGLDDVKRLAEKHAKDVSKIDDEASRHRKVNWQRVLEETASMPKPKSVPHYRPLSEWELALNRIKQKASEVGTGVREALQQKVRAEATGMIGRGAVGEIASAATIGGAVGAGAVAVAEAISAGLEKAAGYGSELKQRYSDLNKEAHQLDRTARLSGASDGLSELTKNATEARRGLRHINDESEKAEKHPWLRTVARTAGEVFTQPGRVLSAIGGNKKAQEDVFGNIAPGPDQHLKGRAQTDLSKADQDRVKSAEQLVHLQELELSGSQREIRDAKIDIEYEQEKKVIQSFRSKNQDELLAKIERERQLKKSITDSDEKARSSQLSSEIRLAQITNEQAGSLQKNVDLARERANEAITQEKVASGRGPEEQAAARAGTIRAAGGQAEAESKQFEAGADEYNMTQAQKAAQYSQRLEQFRNLDRYARLRHEGGIVKPEYGAVEYDPMAGRKAARAQEIAEQGQQAAQQQQSAQETEKRKVVEREQAGKAAAGLGVDISNPNVDISKLAEIQRSKEAAAGQQAQGHSEEPGGYIKDKGMWHSLNPVDSGATPQFNNSPMTDPRTQPGAMPQPGVLPIPNATGPDMNSLPDKVAAAVATVMRDVWGV